MKMLLSIAFIFSFFISLYAIAICLIFAPKKLKMMAVVPILFLAAAKYAVSYINGFFFGLGFLSETGVKIFPQVVYAIFVTAALVFSIFLIYCFRKKTI